MVARRRLLMAGAAGGMTLLLPRSVPARSDPDTGGLLDPAQIPKYVTDLFVPPVLAPDGDTAGRRDAGHER